MSHGEKQGFVDLSFHWLLTGGTTCFRSVGDLKPEWLGGGRLVAGCPYTARAAPAPQITLPGRRAAAHTYPIKE